MDNQPEAFQKEPPELVNKTPLVPTPKKSKLSIALILILMVFLFIFGGITLGKYLNVSQNNLPIPTLAPKPTVIPTTTLDSTTNWKLYTSVNRDFTMKYPGHFYTTKIAVYQGGGDEIYLADSQDTIKKWQQNIPLSAEKILIQPITLSLGEVGDTSGHSKDEILEKIANRLGTSKLVEANETVPWVNENGGTMDGKKNYYSATFTKLIIDGKSAVKVVNTDKITYIIMRDNDQIRISASPANSVFINDFDKMLFTFKFTDQTKIIDTTNWKTYTNTQFQYSLKYPADFLLYTGNPPKDSQADGIQITNIYPDKPIKSSEEESDKGVLWINIAGEVSNTTPKWWTDTVEKNNSEVGHGSSANTINVLKEFTFQGKSAIEVDEYSAGPLNGKQKVYWVLNNNKIFRIQQMFGKNEKAEIVKTFDQILSTFNFN